MVLALTQQHISEMSAHAERVYPEECCGLMLGELEIISENDCTQKQLVQKQSVQKQSVQKQLTELVAVENQWSAAEAVAESEAETLTKQRRYAIAPQDMLRIQKLARDKDLKIIGIYHSHPDQVAVPSECDRVQAWPEYAYTILSLGQGKTVDIRNWALDSDHQFQPEAIEVVPSGVVSSEEISSSAADRVESDRMPLPA